MIEVLLVLAPVMLGPAAADPDPQWQAPVAGEVEVVRPFDRPESAWGPGHRGVDLAAASSAAVRAAGAGRVSFAGRVAGRGVVVVAHRGGLRTSYEPVRAGVRVGAKVAAGDRLGTRDGRDHCRRRSCLHWGLRRGTTYLDPMTLLTGREPAPVVLLPISPTSGTGGDPLAGATSEIPAASSRIATGDTAGRGVPGGGATGAVAAGLVAGAFSLLRRPGGPAG